MNAGMGVPIFFFLFWIVLVGIGILAFVFWVWMLIDCALNEPSASNDKIVWILIIFFLHFLGALLYFFLRRPQRLQTLGH